MVEAKSHSNWSAMGLASTIPDPDESECWGLTVGQQRAFQLPELCLTFALVIIAPISIVLAAILHGCGSCAKSLLQPR